MQVCQLLRPVVPFVLVIACLIGTSPAASNSSTLDKNHQVIVDVVVTDESGQPVKGLREQDFKLSENGKRQKPDSFDEHTAQPDQTIPEPVTLPQNTFTNAASSTPDSIGVILLDQLNTSFTDQEIGRREVAAFIRTKPAAAAFAIFTLRNDDPSCAAVPYNPWSLQPGIKHPDRCTSLGKLRMVQGITADKDRLLTALNSSMARPHHTWLRAALDPLTNDPIPLSSVLEPWNSFSSFGPPLYGSDSYPSTLPEVYDSSMLWLAELGHFLQNLPGRKSLIWISDNFDAAPIAQYVEYWFPPKFKGWESVNPTSPTQMTHLAADRLSLARVALYPVDLTGRTGKIEVRRVCQYGWQHVPGTIYAQALTDVPPESEAGVCSSHYLKLDYVSSQTGGTTFHSGAKVQEAIAQAVSDESNYYTLTYSASDDKFNGKVRNIKIAVQDKNYQLGYRRTYWADDPSTVNRPANAASPDLYLTNPQGPIPWRVARVGLNISQGTPGVSDATRWGAPELNDIIFSAHIEPTDKLRMATPEQMEQLRNYESFRREEQLLAIEHLDVDKIKTGQKVVLPDLPPDPTFVQPYSIDYTLAGKQLAMLDMGNNKHEFRLEVAILAFDDMSRKVTGQELTIAGNVPDSQLPKFQSSDYRVHQTIQLPERTTVIRLALRDVRTGRMGSLQIPVRAISSPYERKKLEVPSIPQLKVRN